LFVYFFLILFIERILSSCKGCCT